MNSTEFKERIDVLETNIESISSLYKKANKAVFECTELLKKLGLVLSTLEIEIGHLKHPDKYVRDTTLEIIEKSLDEATKLIREFKIEK